MYFAVQDHFVSSIFVIVLPLLESAQYCLIYLVQQHYIYIYIYIYISFDEHNGFV